MPYRVKIYQINSDRDKNRVIFAGSDFLMKNECDSVGFKRIRFDESKTQKPSNLLL